MKRFVTIAIFALLTFFVSAQDGKSIYNKYSNGEKVSAVYISPAMFRMMGKLPEMKVSGEELNLSSIITSFNGLYLIDSENALTNKNLKSDIESFVRKGKYELLLEAKDEGETVQIYTVGTDMITRFVLYTIDADECTFICIDGNIKKEDLEKMLR